MPPFIKQAAAELGLDLKTLDLKTVAQSERMLRPILTQIQDNIGQLAISVIPLSYPKAKLPRGGATESA